MTPTKEDAQETPQGPQPNPPKTTRLTPSPTPDPTKTQRIPPGSPYLVNIHKELGTDTRPDHTNALNVTYAGFWQRVAAGAVDWLLMMVAYTVVYLIALASMSDSDRNYGEFATTVKNINHHLAEYYTFWIILPACILYHTIMEASCLQASLGKIALDLRVTDLNVRRVGYLRALTRAFFRELLLGFLVQPFTARRQGFHDVIAGCIVISTRRSSVADSNEMGVGKTERMAESPRKRGHNGSNFLRPVSVLMTEMPESRMVRTASEPSLADQLSPTAHSECEADDRNLYTMAYQETQDGQTNRDVAVWAMALVRARGDPGRCQAFYIEQRVSDLKKQRRKTKNEAT